MIRRILILSVSLFLALPMLADGETSDSVLIGLFRQYYRLYDTDSTEEFYKLSGQILQIYRERKDLDTYYIMRQNEISYDADHGEPYKAITKANNVLEEMQRDGIKLYNVIYYSLGAIFESRGNYGIAVHYYQEALDNTSPTDTLRLAHIYSKMVTANMSRDVEKSWEWNERLASVISPNSIHYKLYLTLKEQLYFFMGDKENFFKVKPEFDKLAAKYSSIYYFGDYAVKIMETAFEGKYDEALQLLEQDSQDYDGIKRYDIRIRILEMMGRNDLALWDAEMRREYRDSISNDLLFTNINEINATTDMIKLKDEAAKEHDNRLGVVIILLFVALGLAISRSLAHRDYQKRALKQNEQLEMALDEAKESDRMKSSFIKHVSHEMHTPLDSMIDCIRTLANPAVELDKGERDKLLQTISKDTLTITGIVNNLLEVSLEESKGQHHKDAEA